VLREIGFLLKIAY